MPLLLAALFLLFSYGPGLPADLFQIDDRGLILLPQIRAAWDSALFRTLFTPGGNVDFYPIRDLSYWIDIHWLGADTTGADGSVYRLHNFLLVFVSAWLVRELLRLFGLARGAASLFAALWLLLPMHSELLMWPSARKDCLAILSGLFSAYGFVRYRRGDGWAWAAAALLAFLLGLLSKATWSLLPLTVPMAAVLLREPLLRDRRSLALWVPAAALGLASSWVQSSFYAGVNDMRFHYSWDYRMGGVLAAFGRMVAGVVYPPIFAVDVENWGDWLARNAGFIPLGVLGLASLLAATFWAWRRRAQPAAWALSVFWLSYLPVSALVFPHRNFYSVRYFEALLLPLFFLGAYYAWRFYQAKPLRWLPAALGLFLFAAAVGSWSEARVWEVPTSPFRKALERDPGNPSLLRLLRDELMNQRRWGRLSPDEVALLAEVDLELSAACGPAAEKDEFRNSHLCLSYWASYDHMNPVLSHRAVADVNPAMAERLAEKLRMQAVLRGQRRFSGESALAGGEASEDARLRHVFSLCLADKRNEAVELYQHWRSRHLVSDEGLVVALDLALRDSLPTGRALQSCLGGIVRSFRRAGSLE